MAVLTAVVGLSAILEAWPDPFDGTSVDFFKTGAPLAAVFGLALFVEIVLVLEPFDPENIDEGLRGTVRSLVRTNCVLLLLSGGAALYAIGSSTTSTFLVGCVLLPWLVQLLLLVDTAYHRIGLNRLRGRASR